MSATVASIWTVDHLARYGMTPVDRHELLRAGLVPDFSADPPHVRRWRAELLRSCAGMPGGSSVHCLARIDPSGRAVSVLAYFWPGDTPRLVVSADTEEHAPGIWNSWIAAPLLAVSSASDPATLDDADPLQGPPPYLARTSLTLHRAPPFVLRHRWLDTTNSTGSRSKRNRPDDLAQGACQ